VILVTLNFVMNAPTRLLYPIAAITLGCLISGRVVAAPTVEQVKEVIQKKGIPAWQAATAQVKAMRANPPNVSTAEAWKALDGQNEEDAFARVTNPRDAKDLNVMSYWLRWRILSENADGRYSYLYGANLSYVLDQKGAPAYLKEAAVLLFHARLSLAVDGARCRDRASPESVVTGYETQPYLRPLVEQVSKMPKREKSIAMLEAVALEEFRGERQLLKRLCMRGAATALKALSSGVQPMPQESDKSSLGKTYSIDVSGVEPDLLSEEEWKLKRRQVLDNFIRSAAEAL
jgi:hypothetical protein